MSRNREETIVVRNLPGVVPESSCFERTYRFEFIRPSHIPSEKRLVLHIAEHAARDAEGQPAYPEQAAWVRKMIHAHGFAMSSIWHSHWAFDKDEDIDRFKALLFEGGARVEE